MLSRKIFVKASGIECFNSVLRFTHTKKTYDDVVNVSNILNEQILYKISYLQLFNFYIYINTNKLKYWLVDRNMVNKHSSISYVTSLTLSSLQFPL